jgi:predicted permease
MKPDDREIEDEIRSHLALSIQERIDRGEDPAAARRAALDELGYVPVVRESIRRVWYRGWFDAASALARDMRIGQRSLLRAKGLSLTVVVTLALGIGANAAIFSVVRSVLLRPLVNRGEDRLVYLRQSAPGIDVENTTFSVPEINDFRSRVASIGAFGDFSVVQFTLLSEGEPRRMRAGVVDGSFFDVMGLRPVLGRLIGPADDGPRAKPAVVLTNVFWTGAFNRDETVIGRPIRLGSLTATIVGVLEPCVPYPANTEIIANMVASPHHPEATMNTDRRHRMTELFGRLAPGATLEQARAELTATHTAMLHEHPEAYSEQAHVQLAVTPLRDQITAPARTILLVLLAAAGVVFIIACSNVANLILARSVRREGELVVRAALGASRGALRRTLLAESLVLCGAGAGLGMLLARPLVSVVAAYAARFSIRALEVTVDSTVLWVGAGLAVAAAVLLAYVPRLPASTRSSVGEAGAFALSSGSLRITPSTTRRLRTFATAQVAFSFVLLAGASMLVATLIALQRANTGYDTRRVLVLDTPGFGDAPAGDRSDRYGDVTRRIRQLPGVDAVAGGSFVPWRDAGSAATFEFGVEGYTAASGEENPHARPRYVGPTFFATIGLPIIAGREFTDADRLSDGSVVIISQSIARRFFPTGEAVDRHIWTVGSDWWRRSTGVGSIGKPSRIVGVVADVDDENVTGGSAMTIYSTQRYFIDRLFVRTSGDPYALVPSVTRVLREFSANQPAEHAATLEDVREQVLTPERLNAFVVAGFAGIALLIAVVGVAGVLAFTVSARMREFGIRLAIGSAPRQLLLRVLTEGAFIVAVGIATGVAVGYALAGVAASYFAGVRLPGALPVCFAATLLGVAGVVAALVPAARASRVDVLRALRAE